jgi:hypothetical protein
MMLARPQMRAAATPKVGCIAIAFGGLPGSVSLAGYGAWR